MIAALAAATLAGVLLAVVLFATALTPPQDVMPNVELGGSIPLDTPLDLAVASPLSTSREIGSARPLPEPGWQPAREPAPPFFTIQPTTVERLVASAFLPLDADDDFVEVSTAVPRSYAGRADRSLPSAAGGGLGSPSIGGAGGGSAGGGGGSAASGGGAATAPSEVGERYERRVLSRQVGDDPGAASSSDERAMTVADRGSSAAGGGGSGGRTTTEGSNGPGSANGIEEVQLALLRALDRNAEPGNHALVDALAYGIGGPTEPATVPDLGGDSASRGPGGSGASAQAMAVTAAANMVPATEPASLLLLGSGLAMTAWRARRRLDPRDRPRS